MNNLTKLMFRFLCFVFVHISPNVITGCSFISHFEYMHFMQSFINIYRGKEILFQNFRGPPPSSGRTIFVGDQNTYNNDIMSIALL